MWSTWPATAGNRAAMTAKLVFLSHIHEEAALATIIKDALVDEFGGFVDVFQSSDDATIPAGYKWFQKIERGLVDCAGAVFLISPASVNRNWINFELGAVWIRNVIANDAGQPSIPTSPMCHSGMTPATLPTPTNYLNAVSANDAAKLAGAFTAVTFPPKAKVWRVKGERVS